MVYRTTRGAALNWRKGSRSGSANECVEVAASGRVVLIRDSRDLAAGMLALDPAGWRALVRAVRNGELDGR
ncbi:DUF397 domain-containing protein [Actinomadura opuntiae]|uniref:DUF397 domain-containing protein n=1 Tax=Actinomadura sp. OS1-43 TaxID=604315 RepID=UPI00255ABDA8|nr:DUF397 domain-containing protein [Actinomadura sp. OS1-43]MDL4815287.1 DUF397 domain-containing protein [Actinomadura sp. OS1-43]